MDEKELLTQSEEKSFIFSSFHKVVVVVIVIFIALFLGNILFGTRSYEVMQKLEDQESRLQKSIKLKKIENEKLQKKLFEYQLTVPE